MDIHDIGSDLNLGTGHMLPSSTSCTSVAGRSYGQVVRYLLLESWMIYLLLGDNNLSRLRGIDQLMKLDLCMAIWQDPVCFNGASAAGMSEFEEFVASGNWMPWLPSNAPQETGGRLHVSSLNTVNASSQDPRNIQNDPIIHEYPCATEFTMNTV